MRISDWSSDGCSSDLLVDRRHTIYVGDDAARVVDRQDRRGLGAIFGHARAHSLGIVVGAALDLVAAAAVARVRDLRQLVAIVIAGAAFRAGATAGDAVDQRVLTDDEHDALAELAAARGQPPVERPGRRRGAREAARKR